MKFIESFICRSIKKVGTEYYISKTALNILLKRKSFSLLEQVGMLDGYSFIPVKKLPPEIKNELSLESVWDDIDNVLYKRFENNTSLEPQICSDLEFDLINSAKDYKKYIYDFISYGFSEQHSRAKSETLCMMYVIKRFLAKYDNPCLLYRVIKNLKVKGEIDCASAKRFCRYISWLLRRGIFEGLLLGR